jgi:putative copper export protein
MTGHATVATPFWVSVSNDALHLVAGAAWITGIVVFAVILPDAWRGKDDPERLALLAPSVVRFSTVAAASVAVLAITGVVNSLLHVGQLNDFVDTGYGIFLALKIVAFLGVLALGAVNHYYVRRRLERAVTDSATTPAAKLFRKTIAIEFATALLILGLTGVLTGLARTRAAEVPPRSPAATVVKPGGP